MLDAGLLALGTFLFVLAAFSIFSTQRSLTPQRRAENHDLSGDTLVFLLRGGTLLDANISGFRLLDSMPGNSGEVDALATYLHDQFGEIGGLLDSDNIAPEQHLTSEDGQLQLIREYVRGSIRLKLSPTARAQPGVEDIHRLAAMEAELETLRTNTETAPFLAWRCGPDGRITWVNRAYLDLVETLHGKERRLSWPPPPLFGDLKRLAPNSSMQLRRMALKDAPDTHGDWFDCHIAPVGRDTLYTAFDASDAVKAERQLREFMQTLTKTFAHLTIGLANFDRSRSLALFNPALTDLTALPPDFLSGRPTMIGFLDKLRERQMMPEPKDYKSWRKSLTELEEAAADGTYCETWALTGDRTYRVTGRPHPDGAIAFLFEDISAEMSLTRRFRSELELGQAIFNSLDEAVAVFSPAGQLSMSNQAFHDLWGFGPDGLMDEFNITSASQNWRELTAPTPVWGDLHDFVGQPRERAEWNAAVRLRDGRSIACRFVPMPGGATLTGFRLDHSAVHATNEVREVV